MIFVDFTKTVSGSTILFKNSTAIEYVTNLKFYTDDATGSFSKKEFRWSFDENHWSSWDTLNQGNFTKINTRSNRYLYLEIRYVVIGTANVTLFSVNYLSSSTSSQSTSSCTTTTTDAIDADTLCGKSCDYYLWRPNHKGEQPIASITDLQNILNSTLREISNIPGGDASIYSFTSSNTAYLKTLSGGSNVTISEDSSTITISSTGGTGDIGKYTGTFDGTADSSLYISAITHDLGIGPLQSTIYDGTEQVYISVDNDAGGNITFFWTAGSLSSACKYILIG